MKACPFCGNGDISCEVLDDGWKFVEVCRTCKARGPVYRTMVEALKGWDARPAVKAEVEALTDKLRIATDALTKLDYGHYGAEVQDITGPALKAIGNNDEK